ncbi:MAG: aminotransferase [Candidatus Coatesbacteria bacterium]|nr:MAG: aminotransferase [Candidatus Coatesbacteria bacterium]
MVEYEMFYSNPTTKAKRSEIRELLKLTRKPEIISFAGGLPSPLSFPVKDIKEICQYVLEKDADVVLQYGPTEGDMSLKEELAKWMEKDNIRVSPEQILITNGSQQGLDLVGKIFLNQGDIIIVEMPTYIGGLQAFNSYMVRMEGVLQDNNGMNMDLLERKLGELKGRGEKPKFIYVVPDFQNPSGVTMPEDRRRKLLELASEYDTMIIEDSPYRELRYTGNQPPPIYSLDTEGRVVSMATFSKIFCPGFRLAWIYGPAPLIDKMVMAKQGIDLCSPSFNQAVAAEFMRRGLLSKHIEKIKEMYKEKRQLMLDSLEKYMPDSVSWTKPEGGLFLWVKLPEDMNTVELLKKAIENNVAYVIGSAFHYDGSGKNTMRLNFSFPSKEQIVEGIKRLSEVIKKEM